MQRIVNAAIKSVCDRVVVGSRSLAKCCDMLIPGLRDKFQLIIKSHKTCYMLTHKILSYKI